MNAKELIKAGIKPGDAIYDCIYSIKSYKVISLMTEDRGNGEQSRIIVESEDRGTPYVITNTTNTYALTKQQAVDIWIGTLNQWLLDAHKLKESLV